MPEVSVARVRARHEVCLRELGRESEDVRFPFWQGDLAAGNVARADAEVARGRADGSADRLQVVAHGPELQGVSREAARRPDRARTPEGRAEAGCEAGR